MGKPPPVRVRMFGLLHTLRKERGLPDEIDCDVPPEGMEAARIAALLDLPLDRIEAVICNHRARPLSHVVLPGDRIAFLPYGTPGPHRFTLGIYGAGKGKG